MRRQAEQVGGDVTIDGAPSVFIFYLICQAGELELQPEIVITFWKKIN